MSDELQCPVDIPEGITPLMKNKFTHCELRGGINEHLIGFEMKLYHDETHYYIISDHKINGGIQGLETKMFVVSKRRVEQLWALNEGALFIKITEVAGNV